MIIITSKNHTHRKKLDMSLQAGQCLQDIPLDKEQNKLIIAEEKIVLTNCVKS